MGNQAPTSLGGTTVTVAGKPAYVDFVSPEQVNVQVPSGVPAGRQDIVVTTAGGSSAPYTITVNTVEPGLLAPPAFVIGGNQHVAAVFSNTLRFVLPVTVSGAATARAKPGDHITLYGIGFGPLTPDIPAGQIVRQTSSYSYARNYGRGRISRPGPTAPRTWATTISRCSITSLTCGLSMYPARASYSRS